MPRLWQKLNTTRFWIGYTFKGSSIETKNEYWNWRKARNKMTKKWTDLSWFMMVLQKKKNWINEIKFKKSNQKPAIKIQIIRLA